MVEPMHARTLGAPERGTTSAAAAAIGALLFLPALTIGCADDDATETPVEVRASAEASTPTDEEAASAAPAGSEAETAEAALEVAEEITEEIVEEAYEGPPRIRLITIKEHELLGSETRGMERLVRELTSGGFNVLLDPPTDAELAYGRAWAGGTRPETMPSRWEDMRGVILLQWFPPTELSRNARRGARVTGGIGSTLTLRPPSSTPVLEERAGPGSMRILRGSTVRGWAELFLPLMRADLDSEAESSEEAR